MQQKMRAFCLSRKRCCALRFFSDQACDRFLGPPDALGAMVCKLLPPGAAEG